MLFCSPEGFKKLRRRWLFVISFWSCLGSSVRLWELNSNSLGRHFLQRLINTCDTPSLKIRQCIFWHNMPVVYLKKSSVILVWNCAELCFLVPSLITLVMIHIHRWSSSNGWILWYWYVSMLMINYYTKLTNAPQDPLYIYICCLTIQMVGRSPENSFGQLFCDEKCPKLLSHFYNSIKQTWWLGFLLRHILIYASYYFYTGPTKSCCNCNNIMLGDRQLCKHIQDFQLLACLLLCLLL